MDMDMDMDMDEIFLIHGKPAQVAQILLCKYKSQKMCKCFQNWNSG